MEGVAVMSRRTRFGPGEFGLVGGALMAVAALCGCAEEPVVVPPIALPPGAQLDPHVPTDMDWRIMLRDRPVETPYGSFQVAMHNLSNIKVSTQKGPDASGEVTTVLGARYRMEDGSYLSILFELKWTVDGVKWETAGEDQKFVADCEYHVKSLRVVSTTPAA